MIAKRTAWRLGHFGCRTQSLAILPPERLCDFGKRSARPPRTSASGRQRALGVLLPVAGPCAILNLVVQYSKARLDASFAALSDATRRGVLEQLGRSDASITDLAEKFRMTLTGIKKHVGVLEQAGLVTTEKVGRVRTCKLGVRRIAGRGSMDRGVPLVLGYASTSSRRSSRDETQGEGRWTQEEKSEPTPMNTAPSRRTDVRARARRAREPSTARRASCSRRLPNPSCSTALVGAEVVWPVPAVLRAGCSCRAHVPVGVQPQRLRADGVLRGIRRSPHHTRASCGPTTKAMTKGLVTTATFSEEKAAARLCWSCMTSIPQRQRSTRPSPPAAR